MFPTKIGRSNHHHKFPNRIISIVHPSMEQGWGEWTSEIIICLVADQDHAWTMKIVQNYRRYVKEIILARIIWSWQCCQLLVDNIANGIAPKNFLA